jgi:hypothetical protein
MPVIGMPDTGMSGIGIAVVSHVPHASIAAAHSAVKSVFVCVMSWLTTSPSPNDRPPDPETQHPQLPYHPGLLLP